MAEYTVYGMQRRMATGRSAAQKGSPGDGASRVVGGYSLMSVNAVPAIRPC